MGRALSVSIESRSARFTHAPSQTLFTATAANTHSATRSGFSASYPLAFAIGSGTHAQGYAVTIAGRLFQSPLTLYRNASSWDVAPGYEQMPAPDFNRPITPECLLCHSSGNSASLEPITCDRCHGNPASHLRQPTRHTIINPARLGRAERDSVCEQCHLNGEARVPNPGKSFAGFQPGQRLEDTFSVFVYDRLRPDLKVVSHSEQLAFSACQRVSQKLWCGTCHRPHGEPVSVSAQCAQCHPSLPPAHPAASAPCESCHMPKRPARDGAHTPFTDHRIQRRPLAAPETAPPSLLRPWRPAPSESVAQRNLGLAYVAAGERDGSASFLNRGYQLLADVFPKFPKDPDVLANLGMVLFLKNQTTDAEKLLRAAVAARPADPALHEKLAVICKAAGRLDCAAQSLEKAISLDPSRETAYHLLADLSADPAKRRAALERYLRFNPQSLIAREALAKLPPP